jgi:DNA-binding Lrp family transcriptional regulator
MGLDVMDRLDKLILLELSANCRISYSVLARKAKVSPNTIKNRVQNLIHQKIISAFIIQFNPALLNLSTAIVSFQFTDRISEALLDQIGNLPSVSAVGSSFDSGFAIALYRDNEELAQLNDDFHSFGNLTEIEILPILMPLTVETTKPTDSLESIQPIDWLILYHLRTNGRIPLSQLTNKTHTSVKTIKKRLDSLIKRNLISQTILMNPGAISRGLMVIFALNLPQITQKTRHSIEGVLRTEHEDNFWVSWQVVDRPVLLLGFQAVNISEVKEIQKNLLKLIPNSTIMKQMIGGEMRYFPDLTDQLLEEKKGEAWFSPDQWVRD